mgnify:FL=1
MILQMLIACIINTTDSLDLFEAKVKSALSSIKYKWAIILVANYHPQSKSVRYILDNFATIDILSKDIDFYFPGYRSEADMPIVPNRETNEKEILAKAISQLSDLSKEKDIPVERLKAIEEKLCLLKDVHEENDTENFHGDSKRTEVECKRLGTIWFSEDAFANFVAELMKKSNGHYKYLGGCDLVMVPFFNNELQYPNCSVYHLEGIANKETKLSVDEFMLRVMDILNQYNGKLNVPHVRYESFDTAKTKFKECFGELIQILGVVNHVPDSIKNMIDKSKVIISQSEKLFNRTFQKQKLIEQFVDVLNEVRDNRDYIVNQVVIRGLLESLYRKATKEISYPSDDEMIRKIIADIERHVNWRFSEDFYFISYSTKDKSKAELIRRLLQERGAKVWIAPDGIPQGRDYSMIIPTTLQYTKNFVLILTENSAKSKWVSREIDAAINNSSTNLKIILANGFQLDQLKRYPDIGFYLNKVQVSYRYEDIIQNAETFERFMK